jgi:hypothetical protein
MTQLAAQSAFPFFHDPDLSMLEAMQNWDGKGKVPFGNAQKGKALFYPANFGATGQSKWTIQQNLSDIGLNAFQGVFIDNSLSPAPTYLYIRGTVQTIVAAPFSQGYYRIMAPNQALDVDVINYATLNAMGLANVVNFEFLNLMPDGADVWTVNPPFAMQGTPFIASAQGANAQQQVTMPNVANRRAYVTSAVLTASGATAGLAVNATLTNIDNGFAAGSTVNLAFVFPTGVAVAAQPVTVSFNPPLPALLGQSAVLTLPAGGAGNTNASATLTGFYQ